MIQLYIWKTPNGRKASIMLEELGIPYEVHPVNLGSGDQFSPEFLAINPNNKIPAIMDPDGPGGKPFKLFESGAILMYLAEKTGKFMPAETAARYQVIQWLMFQMGGVGPVIGQTHHFMHAAPEKLPYAIERFREETERLYRVLEKRLGEEPYLAGSYSIADIATYPWIGRYEHHKVKLESYPNVKRWFDTISSRPAVQRGMEIPKV